MQGKVENRCGLLTKRERYAYEHGNKKRENQ